MPPYFRPDTFTYGCLLNRHLNTVLTPSLEAAYDRPTLTNVLPTLVFAPQTVYEGMDSGRRTEAGPGGGVGISFAALPLLLLL